MARKKENGQMSKRKFQIECPEKAKCKAPNLKSRARGPELPVQPPGDGQRAAGGDHGRVLEGKDTSE